MERLIEVFQVIFQVKIAAIKVTSKCKEKRKIAQRTRDSSVRHSSRSDSQD